MLVSRRRADVTSLYIETDVALCRPVHAELPNHNLRGLWHNEMRPMTGLPDTECVPYLWAWKEQRGVVLRTSYITWPTWGWG